MYDVRKDMSLCGRERVLCWSYFESSCRVIGVYVAALLEQSSSKLTNPAQSACAHADVKRSHCVCNYCICSRTHYDDIWGACTVRACICMPSEPDARLGADHAHTGACVRAHGAVVCLHVIYFNHISQQSAPPTTSAPAASARCVWRWCVT